MDMVSSFDMTMESDGGLEKGWWDGEELV